MLQPAPPHPPPHHHLSDPACPHCLGPLDLCMCRAPGWAPLRLRRGMSSPEAGPWPVPLGRRMPAICWQRASLPHQWPAGKVGGCKGWRVGEGGGSLVTTGDNRCLLKPQGTSLKASPPCNFCLATGGVRIHPHSYISPLSVMWPFWVRESRAGRGAGEHSLSPLTCAGSRSATCGSVSALVTKLRSRHVTGQHSAWSFVPLAHQNWNETKQMVVSKGNPIKNPGRETRVTSKIWKPFMYLRYSYNLTIWTIADERNIYFLDQSHLMTKFQKCWNPCFANSISKRIVQTLLLWLELYKTLGEFDTTTTTTSNKWYIYIWWFKPHNAWVTQHPPFG